MTDELSRNIVKKITARMVETLKAVEQEFGISITYTGSRFSAKNATIKFEMAVINPSGTAETKERTKFKAQSYQYGINANMLDAKILIDGITYIIRGMGPRAGKYPFICERRPDGVRFKMNSVSIKNGMANHQSQQKDLVLDELSNGL